MTEALPIRRNLELLTSVRPVGGTGPLATTFFGNILELGAEALVLESGREHGLGEKLELKVVFPGQRDRARRTAFLLPCTVRRVRDADRLLYDLTIEGIEDEARAALAAYLSRAPAKPAEEGR